MKCAKLLTAVGVIIAATCIPLQTAAAADQAIVVTNKSDTRFVEKTWAFNHRKTPDSLTLRVLDGSIDASTSTPTGKQLEWKITDETSSSTRKFAVEMNGDVSLKIHQKSGAIIVSLDGNPVALIESPWAKDANGAIVPTYFTTEGNTFTQHVNTSAGNFSYPITADPRVNWGIISGHIYFSKEETRKMAAGAAAAAAITPFWFLVPPPVGEALGVWWVANTYSITAWATAAVAQDKCLALKVGVTGSDIPPELGVSSEHYTDGCV